MQHDNGKEFDNELLRSFCNKNGIKQIKSSIRHPQSQGAVEKLNHFLNQSLSTSLKMHKKKSDQAKFWNIESALKVFINNRNNKNHKVTKVKPNCLIVSKDSELMENVRNRIQSYYEKRISNQDQRSRARHIFREMRFSTFSLIFLQNNFYTNKNSLYFLQFI